MVRSQAYQYLFCELAFDSEWFDSLASENQNPILIDRLNELQEQLDLEYQRLINTSLTDRQSLILRLICDGYSQTEIGTKLGITQPMICRTINGTYDYQKKISYGGIKRKLQNAAATDPVILDLKRQIAEVIEDIEVAR